MPRGLAVAAGVRRISWAERDELVARDATTYCFDVRDPAEFEAGHRRGFRLAPGGQLIQETDFFAPVRGATIILSDDGRRPSRHGGVVARADGLVGTSSIPTDHAANKVVGPWQPSLPPRPTSRTIAVAEVAQRLAGDDLVVLDLATSQSYRAGHLPGAQFVLRSELIERLRELPASCIVLASPDGVLAEFAAAEVFDRGGLGEDSDVYVLDGGTNAWRSAGLELEVTEQRWLSPPA